MRIIDVINKKNDYDWVEKKVKTILDSLEYCDGNSDKIMLDFCNQYGIEIGQIAKFWKLIHNTLAQQSCQSFFRKFLLNIAQSNRMTSQYLLPY